MGLIDYSKKHHEVLEPIQSTRLLDCWFVGSEHRLLHPNGSEMKQMMLAQLNLDPS